MSHQHTDIKDQCQWLTASWKKLESCTYTTSTAQIWGRKSGARYNIGDVEMRGTASLTFLTVTFVKLLWPSAGVV